jgi:hypothetical protein
MVKVGFTQKEWERFRDTLKASSGEVVMSQETLERMLHLQEHGYITDLDAIASRVANEDIKPTSKIKDFYQLARFSEKQYFIIPHHLCNEFSIGVAEVNKCAPMGSHNFTVLYYDGRGGMQGVLEYGTIAILKNLGEI